MRLTVFASLPLLATGLLLAGCDVHSNTDTKGGHDVHIAVDAKDGEGGKVAINVPGFDAKVSIPQFMMNGGHMDIDGMKLAPETAIKSVDVMGHDDDKKGDGDGSVHMTFTNPKAPADLLTYYKQAAGDAGFTVNANGDGGLDGNKGAKKFSLKLSDEGSGSRGAIDISGSD